MTLIDIAEAIRVKLDAALTLIGYDGSLERSFDPQVSLPTEQNVGSKEIFIVPMGVEFREAATRATDRNVYRIGILLSEKFSGELKTATGKAGMLAFMDANIAFVETNLYLPLKSVTYQPVTGARLESATWRVVYSPEYLRDYSLFWSEIDLEYFIDETNTV